MNITHPSAIPTRTKGLFRGSDTRPATINLFQTASPQNIPTEMPSSAFRPDCNIKEWVQGSEVQAKKDEGIYKMEVPPLFEGDSQEKDISPWFTPHCYQSPSRLSPSSLHQSQPAHSTSDKMSPASTGSTPGPACPNSSNQATCRPHHLYFIPLPPIFHSTY
jgi:hypothetical protein